MMCSCIKEVEEKINDLMNERVGKIKNAVVTEKAVLTIRGLLLDGSGWKMFAPAEGRYSQGKKSSIFKTSILFSFCPFCGQKIN